MTSFVGSLEDFHKGILVVSAQTGEKWAVEWLKSIDSHIFIYII